MIDAKQPKRKKIAVIFGVAAGIVVLGILYALFGTPVPAARFLRNLFAEGSNASAPAGFAEMQSDVEIIRDISYPSTRKLNQLDLFLPIERDDPLPTVLWVHGGAFVGGNKSDVDNYATALASEGYAVASINYELAPEANYPSPLLQTEEAYRWLESVKDTYSLDLTRFALAGDSAGAHIVTQFSVIQTSPVYAEAVQIEPVVPEGGISALLLYCGPFDLKKLDEIENTQMKYLLSQAAWAYFGTRQWIQRFGDEVSIVNHIPENFPPAFITDGNTASFEDHGRELAEVLNTKGVPTVSYFIPVEEATTMHEYQFRMNTPYGEEAYRRTVDFLAKYLR